MFHQIRIWRVKSVPPEHLCLADERRTQWKGQWLLSLWKTAKNDRLRGSTDPRLQNSVSVLEHVGHKRPPIRGTERLVPQELYEDSLIDQGVVVTPCYGGDIWRPEKATPCLGIKQNASRPWETSSREGQRTTERIIYRINGKAGKSPLSQIEDRR